MATCLYKPKPCEQCGRVIQVGDGCEYNAETKGVSHYDCVPPSGSFAFPEQFALAERLGFIVWHHDMPAEGLLLKMERTL